MFGRLFRKRSRGDSYKTIQDDSLNDLMSRQIPQETRRHILDQWEGFRNGNIIGRPREFLSYDVFLRLRRGDVGIPKQEKASALLLIEQLNSACAVWMCRSCVRVIGLLKPLAHEPVAKYVGLVMLVALQDDLKCHACGQIGTTLLAPQFLVSGASFEDQMKLMRTGH